MTLQSPHLKPFAKDFEAIAQQFNLNPENLIVEFYIPKQQAILVERVDGQAYKIHINLQESRIVSIKRVAGTDNGVLMTDKYRQFMR